MKNFISKYIVLFPYILAFTQLFKLPGINSGCMLLSLINLGFIISNWNILFNDKTGIIKYSILYVLMILSYQALTPPLSDIYNPYNPYFYHIFITTGITFWIIGYKGIDILNQRNLQIITILIMIALLYALILIYNFRSVTSLTQDSDLYVYIYQAVPYLLLWMTSAFFLFKKPIQLSIIFLFIIIVILSTKRGPLVSMGLGFIATLVLQKKITIKHLILYTLVFTIVYIIINMYFESYLTEWLERWTEKDDDVSNGRDQIWELLMNHFGDQDIITHLFGNGYEASHIITYKYLWNGIGAHNDFIDILYNMGIIGLTIFSLLILSWIKITFSHLKRNSPQSTMLIYLLICFLLGSIVSSNLTRIATVFFSIYFYYFAGIQSREIMQKGKDFK